MSGKDKVVEIRALAGARALPPVLIVLFHFGEGHHYYHQPLIDALARRGYLWVEFFFALSGFILTHVYGARVAQLFTTKGYGTFLRSRLARLYPLHIFILLALLLLMTVARTLGHIGHYETYYDGPYHPIMSLKGFVLSALLMHAWNTMGSLTWNTPSWFVSVEWALCLLFPLYLWLAGAKSWRGLVLIAAGLAGLWLMASRSGFGLDITFHNGVLRGMLDFSVGVGAAVVFGRMNKVALPSWLLSLVQLALLAALWFALTHNGWAHNAGDFWVVLPMLGLIPALAFDRGWVAAALKTRPLQVIGGWSYAVYLGQGFWLQAIRLFEARLFPPDNALVFGTRFADLNFWLEPLSLVIVCVIWGALLARYVEHPAAKWLKPARQ